MSVEDRHRIRPLSVGAGIQNRGYSRPLQRVISDFGADHAFGQVVKKLEEHYGISAPVDIIRKITEGIGEAMKGFLKDLELVPGSAIEPVIGEVDGCMLPVVERKEAEKTGENPENLAEPKRDQRKNKSLCYKECRLTLAHELGSKKMVFGGTFGEDVEATGKQLKRCVEAVGLHAQNYVHVVGDGAPWIVNQVEEQFGAWGCFLVDFYHLCDYLSAAADRCAPTQKKQWMEEQKALLKENKHSRVLVNLLPHIEPPEVEDAHAPVRACHRYIRNRAEHLDYQGSLKKGLPIGSGEIESAHRYVVQKRLKLAGAWWKPENLPGMLALRICRQNDHWNQFWKQAA